MTFLLLLFGLILVPIGSNVENNVKLIKDYVIKREQIILTR